MNDLIEYPCTTCKKSTCSADYMCTKWRKWFGAEYRETRRLFMPKLKSMTEEEAKAFSKIRPRKKEACEV